MESRTVGKTFAWWFLSELVLSKIYIARLRLVVVPKPSLTNTHRHEKKSENASRISIWKKIDQILFPAIPQKIIVFELHPNRKLFVYIPWNNIKVCKRNLIVNSLKSLVFSVSYCYSFDWKGEQQIFAGTDS